jgi:hypothetical protein
MCLELCMTNPVGLNGCAKTGAGGVFRHPPNRLMLHRWLFVSSGPNGIECHLSVLTWMVGTNMALTIAILFKLCHRRSVNALYGNFGRMLLRNALSPSMLATARVAGTPEPKSLSSEIAALYNKAAELGRRIAIWDKRLVFRRLKIFLRLFYAREAHDGDVLRRIAGSRSHLVAAR